MTLDNTWFSEPQSGSGTAFSLKITAKLHEEQSQFQKIEIYQTEHFGKLMVIDGYIMLTDRDNFIYHEMMSHPVLFSHPNPEKVLIIGGGDCGTLREVLKHDSVKLAQQVDIDERVTRLSEIHFPELCDANNDPRAELHFADGINWVKDAADASYDVIIVDSTDPIGPGEVLFSTEFYKNCHRILTKNGLVVQQSESPLLHLDSILMPMHQRMKAAGNSHTLTFNFPQCVYPSGWWSCTVGGNFDLASFRENDARNKTFNTLYYNSDIHKAATALPEFMKTTV
ncbi:MAG: polyamine aminopropyltransferase [Gammaproteobacteria bacterium]|nr:polyamine aminopropyltransferase [Gammaproteobacteria bacterium]